MVVPRRRHIRGPRLDDAVTADQGYEYFNRYYFAQQDRQGVILDERFNQGGYIADYFVDILGRHLRGYFNNPVGERRLFTTPQAGIWGPKVLLINEAAGSGGDLLPFMWHEAKIGPMIGTKTWGGLVGILGFPVLMDGGRVTAPNLAFWTDEGFIVENVGVPPDVEVEQWPAAVIAGKDPQLEKAIELVLAELRKSPPKKPERPAFPTTAKPN